jgi:hypothetical protein
VQLTKNDVSQAQETSNESITEATFIYVPQDTMVKESPLVVEGNVVSISETKWNQDSGLPW